MVLGHWELFKLLNFGLCLSLHSGHAAPCGMPYHYVKKPHSYNNAPFKALVAAEGPTRNPKTMQNLESEVISSVPFCR